MLTNIGAWLRGNWEWFKEKAKDKRAVWWFALYSFFDPTVLPVSFDPFLVLLVLADRSRAFFLVLISSFASLLGAVFGYLVISLLYVGVLEPVMRSVGLIASVEALAVPADEVTFGAMFITALTPVPDPPVIIAAGLLQANILVFALAFFAGRTLRSLVVVIVALMFGERVIEILERHAGNRLWGVFTIVLLLVILSTVYFALH